RGRQGLHLREQETERLTMDSENKQRRVRTAELEAEAEKARQVKQAEGQAQVTVLRAKAESDAMQYTLPLKQKQIETTRLEAEARKESTVKNAEAMAEAKVHDSRAEVARGKRMAGTGGLYTEHVLLPVLFLLAAVCQAQDFGAPARELARRIGRQDVASLTLRNASSLPDSAAEEVRRTIESELRPRPRPEESTLTV